jgi:hypothetical protein
MTQSKPLPLNEPDVEAVADLQEAEVPSWFARTYGKDNEADMAERYRVSHPFDSEAVRPIMAEKEAAYDAYRKRIEERFSSARQLADPGFMSQDNVRTTADVDSAFPQRPNFSAEKPKRPRKKPQTSKARGIKPSALAILTLTACCLGGAAGYVAANPDATSSAVKQGWAMASALWTSQPVGVTETVITKKTVRTARLSVRDAAGAINAPIALDISALPVDANTPVMLRISGLPPEAYLTRGEAANAGEWLLKSADIGKAELVVPHSNSPEIALQVSALEEKTGAPAAPSQDLVVAIDTAAVPVPGTPRPKAVAPVEALVIEPASAQADQGFNKPADPAAVPIPLQSLNPEVQSLITKGDTLLASGDILSARQFYRRAFDMKTPQAAYGVGQTYDPAVYARYQIKGLEPDAQLAAEWYGKAAAVGDEAALAALSKLPGQP